MSSSSFDPLSELVHRLLFQFTFELDNCFEGMTFRITDPHVEGTSSYISFGMRFPPDEYAQMRLPTRGENVLQVPERMLSAAENGGRTFQESLQDIRRRLRELPLSCFAVPDVDLDALRRENVAAEAELQDELRQTRELADTLRSYRASLARARLSALSHDAR
ncbi:hypothetical protein GMRT_13168 [Giardia muris]|uniref:Uncharacterized protein n=1 Tax=Giardia muris TaxID=5742 RepID=A0A4Z1SSR5_GIAMU|nr:hypothetical protein GMRT_13168 [Giardia muris]|eukprot:TNJ26688.1 hypothetical protein GMRT_13168 [Giardia muris]